MSKSNKDELWTVGNRLKLGNPPFFLSIYTAKLDGVSEKARRRLAEHHSINDWLEIPDPATDDDKPADGKKRVRKTAAFVLLVLSL